MDLTVNYAQAESYILFTALPRSLPEFHESKLKPVARCLLYFLFGTFSKRRRTGEPRVVFISGIARSLGISRSWASVLVSRLESIGYIKRVSQHRDPSGEFLGMIIEAGPWLLFHLHSIAKWCLKRLNGVKSTTRIYLKEDIYKTYLPKPISKSNVSGRSPPRLQDIPTLRKHIADLLSTLS